MNTVNDLSVFFVAMYQKDKSCLSFLIESFVPKYVLIKTYLLLVRYEQIKSIESLEVDKKMELVNQCRTTGIKFTNESLIQASKIVHTLNEINENI